MRIDKTLVGKDLTKSQSFFLGCWLNMSHDLSLDGDRAPVINPHNGLCELLDLYELGNDFGGGNKRMTAAIELKEILEEDPIFQDEVFTPINTEFLNLLPNDPSQNHEHIAINKREDLTISYIKNLLDKISEHYLSLSFTYLKDAINKEHTSPESQESGFEHITKITGSIISSLISQGASLSDIHSLYLFILTKDINRVDKEKFDRLISHLKHTALKAAEPYKVEYIVRSSGLASIIQNIEDDFHYGNFYIYNSDTRPQESLIAEATIDATSHSFAGAIGYDQLNDLIDALSYTLGKSEITIVKKYESTKVSSGVRKTLKIHRPIPNPDYQFDQDKFIAFCQSIGSNNPINNSSLRDKKIASAFRLFRIGQNSNNIDAKFTSYWTALESITKDIFERASGDDGKVIAAALPCITIDYVYKRLKAFIRTLHHVDKLEFETEGENFNLESISESGLYLTLKEKKKADAIIDSLEDYPFLKYKLKNFSKLCQSPREMGDAIDSHEHKVRRQLLRIYRARNSIVHKAGKVSVLELLCANLEHYFKACLNAMIELMTATSTISSPKECFIRYDYLASQMKIELNPKYKKSKPADREKLDRNLQTDPSNYSDARLIDMIKLHE